MNLEELLREGARGAAELIQRDPALAPTPAPGVLKSPWRLGGPLLELPVRLRRGPELPRELYPGGPEGVTLSAEVREVRCRCGHETTVGMEIPVTLQLMAEMEPGLLERVLAQIARKSAQQYAAEHDCRACAPPTKEAA